MIILPRSRPVAPRCVAHHAPAWPVQAPQPGPRADASRASGSRSSSPGRCSEKETPETCWFLQQKSEFQAVEWSEWGVEEQKPIWLSWKDMQKIFFWADKNYTEFELQTSGAIVFWAAKNRKETDFELNELTVATNRSSFVMFHQQKRICLSTKVRISMDSLNKIVAQKVSKSWFFNVEKWGVRGGRKLGYFICKIL